MKRLAILLAFLSMPAHPDTIILHDGVAVDAPPHCGGEWTIARGYIWPCIIFRDSFSSQEKPK